MRPLTRREPKHIESKRIVFVALLTTGVWTQGCGGGGASSVQPPPPPPPSIVVTVAPKSGSVLLGNTATFSAKVTNTTDTVVIWSVNGVAGGSATVGTITADGVYTAPADLPSPATRTDHGDEPCGCDEIGHGCDHGDERHCAFADAESGERGAWREARIYRAGDERRTSGYGDAVEPLGCGVCERMRSRRCDWELHRASHPSGDSRRDTDSAERG